MSTPATPPQGLPPSPEGPGLLVHAAPFLHVGSTGDTPALMRHVLYALVPVVAAATWWFGWSAVLVLTAAVAGCVSMEALCLKPRALKDGSALLTGVLLGLTLPPSIPLWMAFLGGVVAIGLGKVIWGGLGHNLFNPALVGRAFLQAAFPTAITTWVRQNAGVGVYQGNLALPFAQAPVDAVSTATPLGLMKFQHQGTELLPLVVGNTGGSLGETAGVVLLLSGLYLLWKRAFDWRIPTGILSTVAVFSGVVWALAPDRYPSPLFHLFSGGLLLGAIFMATDPVTSPMSRLATWIYAAGIGVLVVLIRLWGGLPEGVMYAILIMNAVTPLLNRSLWPVPFGRGRASRTPGGAA